MSIPNPARAMWKIPSVLARQVSASIVLLQRLCMAVERCVSHGLYLQTLLRHLPQCSKYSPVPG
jgi:hypothetical protein